MRKNALLPRLHLFFLLISFATTITLNAQCTPIPIIHGGLTVALPPSGSVSVPAFLFNAGSIDKCETGGLSFSFNHLTTGDTRIFDCEDLGERILPIYAIDQFSNRNNVTTKINIQEGTNQTPLS